MRGLPKAEESSRVNNGAGEVRVEDSCMGKGEDTLRPVGRELWRPD